MKAKVLFSRSNDCGWINVATMTRSASWVVLKYSSWLARREKSIWKWKTMVFSIELTHAWIWKVYLCCCRISFMFSAKSICKTRWPSLRSVLAKVNDWRWTRSSWWWKNNFGAIETRWFTKRFLDKVVETKAFFLVDLLGATSKRTGSVGDAIVARLSRT